ncbi:MAG: hypothetical protein P4L69_06795 [Desulfosporosinus sp.]|nr:hypothetical protein [Desulfosporosinus sp.]
MNKFLTFLQIIELIGKWIVALIRNYHITSAIILFVDILDRLGSPENRPVDGWEIFFGSLVFIWYYRKQSAKKALPPESPIINVRIDNENIVGITNNHLLQNENDE